MDSFHFAQNSLEFEMGRSSWQHLLCLFQTSDFPSGNPWSE